MGLLDEIRAGRQYVKRPVAVQVVFAREAGVLQTLEGPVTYAAGDAILTGIEGERWPIRRERFASTYEALAPTRMGEPGRYVKQPAPVHAVRARQPRRILLDNGRDAIEAQPGDWLVADAAGAMWVVAASIFEATYAPADPAG